MFNYNAIIGAKHKVTLPSVEAGLGTLNVLRDPPKSITTRRVDKVGETSLITEMIDAATDRACEAISVYPRGLNPMVSVSYSNNGNNGGQRGGFGFSHSSIGGENPKLPYQIMRDGVFRPPILTQRQTIPLSRLPRAWTTVSAKPGFVDFTKKMMCPGSSKDYKACRPDTIKCSIRPTAVKSIEMPIRENYEVKYVIKDPIKVSANSGIRTINQTSSGDMMGIPTYQIESNPLHSAVHSQISSQYNQDGEMLLDTERYIQDANYSAVSSKTSKERGVTYLHNDISLERNLPEYIARTNIENNIYSAIEPEYGIELERKMPYSTSYSNPSMQNYGIIEDPQSKNYSLNPKISPNEGFTGRVGKQTFDRNIDVNESYQSERNKLQKSVQEQFAGRYAIMMNS